MLVVILAAMFSSAAFSSLQGAGSSKPRENIVADTIEANAIVVRSRDGSSITLETMDFGESNRSAALVLRDMNGAERALLRIYEKEAHFEMNHEDGELALRLKAHRSDASSLVLYKGGSSTAAFHSGENGSFVSVNGPNGKQSRLPQ